MILIAESKTMASAETDVSREKLAECRPQFDGIANAIMDSLRDRTPEQLAAEAGITLRLAASLRRMIYEFPNKSTGLRAIEAFTGVVFRQLRLAGYDAAQKKFLQDNVRIASSLYGWLRPDDIVKPYRFDFKSHVAPLGETLMKYWKKDVTIAMAQELRAKGDTVIIDLLPSDAAKCVDWKLIKQFANVYKVDFKMYDGTDVMKTPNAGRLKELRGRLLDLIVRNGISSPADIASMESSDFMPDPAGPRYPSYLSFVTA
ncbi:MAG: YaaA family protein [Bacteroidales bacterium]|nr:YaaA family protein [Bacteroidales bacterium]